jgi:nucleotide-binding universal stress UspA family protein
MGAAMRADILVAGASSHGGRGLGPVASRLIEHAPVHVLAARPGAFAMSLRVLIPVDGSDASLEATAKCADLLATQAEFTLLHVVETHWLRPSEDPEWISGDEDLLAESASELEREMEREAQTVLESARDRLPKGAVVNTMISHGVPADQILSEADSGEYDLIVLVSSGGNDVKHKMLGSVAAKVAWNAPCSVLMVH